MRAHENPFRTERLGRLAFRHPTLSADDVVSRWRTLGRRGAIVGPHGSGKTTLLRELAVRIGGEGFRVRHWFLNAQSPLPRTRTLVREARGLGATDVLLFDGAGHLPWLSWRRIARACRGSGGLIVTAHGEGRLPTLVSTRTDAALLKDLTRELAGGVPAAVEPLLADLFAAHGGNLHDVLLALYDLGARDDERVADLIDPFGPWAEAGSRRPGRQW